MSDMITVRNLETGQVGRIRRDWFENPAINAGILVEAEPGAKSALPEMWRSKLEPENTVHKGEFVIPKPVVSPPAEEIASEDDSDEEED